MAITIIVRNGSRKKSSFCQGFGVPIQSARQIDEMAKATNSLIFKNPDDASRYKAQQRRYAKEKETAKIRKGIEEKIRQVHQGRSFAKEIIQQSKENPIR